MSTPRDVPAAARWGRVGTTWGNVILPRGALRVDDEIRFAEDPPGEVFRVTRVNVFPPDAQKSLYTYLRVRDNTADS